MAEAHTVKPDSATPASDAPLEKLRAYGSDAVAFQALESGLRWWHDTSGGDGTSASVAFLDIGGSWMAVGTPLVAAGHRGAAARRFVSAARKHNRRPVFFGVEQLEHFGGFRRLMLGLQSEILPSGWPLTLQRSGKLREQLRRARAKGVVVRKVAAEELDPGLPLRRDVERLREEWLASRPMEPMTFLVAVEPFHEPREHLYFVAERHGRVVQFLSAVPIHERHGWLMEDMLRGPTAPNGTTELLIDGLMRELGGEPFWVTPGLTPLTGNITWWMRLVRGATVALYDFKGLRRFRARLNPPRWQPVWLVWDRGTAGLVLLDVLRAFAGGELLRFAWRTLVRHPNGPPWAVAVPLVPWTVLLAGLAASGASGVLGFSTAALWAWVAFDAILAWLLFRVARRPRSRSLALLTAAAAFDAAYSLYHLAAIGPGDGVWSTVVRLLATLGPLFGSAGLAWAFRVALIKEEGRRTAHTRAALQAQVAASERPSTSSGRP